MNRSLKLQYRKHLNSVFYFILLGVLSVFVLVPTLEAAIVPTGDVSPVLPWTDSTYGYIGDISDGSLMVDAGSLLQSRFACIAKASGVTGTATVTGAGSKWTSRWLYVGGLGSGVLTIDAGAVVSSSYGYLGSESGSTGTVTVTGAGSNWTNSYLCVGQNGSGILTIENGGEVSSSYGYLGSEFGSTGIATVTGAGSKWTNSYLYVGQNGSGTLTVSDGGEVITGMLYASMADLHGNGTITTQGAFLDADMRFDGVHGTQATVKFGSGGTLKINAEGDLGVGYKGSGSLTVAEGVSITTPSGYLGNESGSTGTATVTGAGSKWTNRKELYVGRSGHATLTIEAGAEVSNQDGYLGYESGSTGTATVTGAGSKWNNSWLYVGRSGNGALTIEDGAEVSSAYGRVGLGTVTVSGAGSKWTSGGLSVGEYGNGTLTIADGAEVNSSDGFLGAGSMATVTGAGSKWTNNSWLSIGGPGRSGSDALTIKDGAEVSSAWGYLGYAFGSTGTATVTGVGSKWTNISELHVGQYGSGTLTVSDGGEVTTKMLYALLADLHGNGTITATQGAFLDADLRFDAAHGTQATVPFGSGGTLKVNAAEGDLGVGYKGGNGSLTVAEGVAITTSFGYLGNESGSTGTATVTGAGSKWTNSGLYVGRSGNGTLTVEAGAEVISSYGYVGDESGSTGMATVTGAGSKWTNRYVLYVGQCGSGTLTVSDGGEVTTEMLYASLADLHGNGTITTQGAVLDADLRFDAAHGTQATVTFGSGGTLKVNAAEGDLGVGYKGGSGSLTVAEGVTITTTSSAFLGYDFGSTGMATVTGTGSKWNNNGLCVGRSGSGTLTIEAGAQVSSFGSCLGYDFGSMGMATVTGTGSKWNSGSLNVGDAGRGTLIIEAGAEVSSSWSIVGFTSGSTGMVTVNGAGSKWNSGSLNVGDAGRGTLIIEAGAEVSSSNGYLGSDFGSTGIATVTGAGSKWTNSYLYVGQNGSGMLTIEAGAEVSSFEGYLGYESGSTGTATVTGAGSKWNSGYLGVGSGGKGTLNIRDGGNVLVSSLSINSSSSLTIDAGYGSNIRVGDETGRLLNAGTVRILTGPGPAAGSQFFPITAATWDNYGTCQALGGTWNDSTHAFTVSQTLTSVSGAPIAIDLAQRQRAFVVDNTRYWTAGVSFLAKTGTGNAFDFTATAVAGSDLNALNTLLEPGQSVLSGWNFTAAGSGYNADDPIYLSFGITRNLSRHVLRLWQFSGGNWSSFTADDLTAAGGYANFTVAGLSGYAVVGTLPSAAWIMDADGVWQNGSHWSSEPAAPEGVNVAATLGPAITAPRTVTLGGPVTLGVLTFESARHYTLAGMDALNLQVNQGYTAEIDVQNSDTHGHVIETPVTISSPLEISIAPSAFLTLSGQVQNPTGQTLTLTGGGTLTVTQGLVTTGTINVEAGTLTTSSLRADTLTIGGGSASVLATVPEPSSLFLLLAATVAIVGRLLIAKK